MFMDILITIQFISGLGNEIECGKYFHIYVENTQWSRLSIISELYFNAIFSVSVTRMLAII